MIPKIIHFIFGLEPNFGGKPFSYIHYLAIASAWQVHTPDHIYFHYAYEPNGKWWELAKKLVTMNRIKPPDKIFGNEIKHYAHKADVIRLECLKKTGGIYLDIDVISLNAFDPLLENHFVMGKQVQRGLCNAVILSEPNSAFVNAWYDAYNFFDHTQWDYHSVYLPFQIAAQTSYPIRILEQGSFFYPNWNDPSLILWDEKINSIKPIFFAFITKIKTFFKSLGYSQQPKFHYPWLTSYLPFKNYHLNRLKKAYCIHLWEKLWWEPYLKNITPDYILNKKNNFSLLIKDRLSTGIITGQRNINS